MKETQIKNCLIIPYRIFWLHPNQNCSFFAAIYTQIEGREYRTENPIRKDSIVRTAMSLWECSSKREDVPGQLKLVKGKTLERYPADSPKSITHDLQPVRPPPNLPLIIHSWFHGLNHRMLVPIRDKQATARACLANTQSGKSLNNLHVHTE